MADGTAIETYLDEVRKEMRRWFRKVNREIAGLRGHMARVHKRKNLSALTKRRHLAALQRMAGMCPCCREVRILDESGVKLLNLHWDHWKAPGSNGIKTTWPVCSACNGRLEDPMFKGRKQTSFAAYQDYLLGADVGVVQRELFGAGGP